MGQQIAKYTILIDAFSTYLWGVPLRYSSIFGWSSPGRSVLKNLEEAARITLWAGIITGPLAESSHTRLISENVWSFLSRLKIPWRFLPSWERWSKGLPIVLNRSSEKVRIFYVPLLKDWGKSPREKNRCNSGIYVFTLDHHTLRASELSSSIEAVLRIPLSM